MENFHFNFHFNFRNCLINGNFVFLAAKLIKKVNILRENA